MLSQGENNPLWYKNAVIYQLHVKSYCDSNGDGIGDFNGLTSKLDYLESLGITAIWLLPFYPSPLRDDGYDIADYYGINPSYGSLKDFKRFLREAHSRGLKVITELVINHTSDQHEWFQKSRQAPPGSAWRDMYVWNDSPDKYTDARIIFKDFETSNWAWDPVAKAYYWHRFYSHQPDLNFEHERVRKMIFKVVDYWMEMGVDGMRLDAVPYLYEQEGTNCENLPETYQYLKDLRTHIDKKFPNRMLLAEANQWPEDAAAYFGEGDTCHMCFHFPLMPRMFMAVHMEDWFPIVDILEQTPAIPQNAQWAIFLRNHDELTLEMVTDEERDYMYRYYAHDPTSRINLGIRRRLAPLLKKSRRRMEIMNILLLSLPGTPIIYYGDEIGMGDNHYLGDRDGVRTPMQWTADRNAGFSNGNPQQLFLPVIIDPEYHFETINVETQERNYSSLLWWTKRVLAVRNQHKAFALGDAEFIHHNNPNVLTFIRQYEGEAILVIVNLSRFAQVVELDLSKYAGYAPVDIFSNNTFPVIKEVAYTLTMGFHDYFWLALEKAETSEQIGEDYTPPIMKVSGNWTDIFLSRNRKRLEAEILPAYLFHRTSAGSRSLPIRTTEIIYSIPVKEPDFLAQIILVRIQYKNGRSDMVLLPLCCCSESDIEFATQGNKGLVMLRVGGMQGGVVYDGVCNQKLHEIFFKIMRYKKQLRGKNITVGGYANKYFKRTIKTPQKISYVKSGKRNTSVNYNNGCYFKLYRRLDSGVNPDVELNQYLTEEVRTPVPIPTFLGWLHFRTAQGETFVTGMMSEWVDHAGSAGEHCLYAAGQFFEEVLSHQPESSVLKQCSFPLFTPQRCELNETVRSMIGVFADTVALLGERIADLHIAFAQAKNNPEFIPEPFTMLYQRSLFQTRRSKTVKLFKDLRGGKLGLDEKVGAALERLQKREKEIIGQFQFVLKQKIRASKMRMHGDLHLGQILATGNDFLIRDFEGPKGRSLSERRLKRSPLRDLASVILSLHATALKSIEATLKLPPVQMKALEEWIPVWTGAVSAILLESYYNKVATVPQLKMDEQHAALLLRMFLIGTAFNELSEPGVVDKHVLLASANIVELCLDNTLPFEDKAKD